MASLFVPTCWICDNPITLETCKIDEYGKGVHAQCYAAKLAHRLANPLVREKEERAWELCAMANTAHDRQEFIAHMQEIRRLLQEAERLKCLGKLA